jgi:RNA recognition motif-containing protein
MLLGQAPKNCVDSYNWTPSPSKNAVEIDALPTLIQASSQQYTGSPAQFNVAFKSGELALNKQGATHFARTMEPNSTTEAGGKIAFCTDVSQQYRKSRMQVMTHDTDDCIDTVKTLMICNLPCRISYEVLVDAIHAKGFGDCVEFVHLPYRSGQPSSNLGYGFVSFYDVEDAQRFAGEFEGYRFQGRGSQKVCSVKAASLQGFNGKLRHRGVRNC